MSVRALLLLALLAAPERKPLRLGETEIHLALSGEGGPRLVHVHGDERTCLAAAAAVLPGRPGRLVDVQAQGERRVHFKLGPLRCSFDPNRVFTEVGLRKSVACTPGQAAVPAALEAARAFADAVQAELGPEGPVVALHNNTEGALSILSYQPGGSEAQAAARVFVARGEDPDDFFLVTQPSHFEALSARGFNVVLQDNARAPDDGSLSVRFGQQGRAYVNVEAQHGHQARQEAMLRAALEVVGAGGQVPRGEVGRP